MRRFLFFIPLLLLLTSCSLFYSEPVHEEPAPIEPEPAPIIEEAKPEPKVQAEPEPVRETRQEPTETLPTISRAQQFISKCPTQKEINQINADFKITFVSPPDPYECIEGSSKSNAQLTIYNMLRLAKEVPFDKNFAWTNHNNLYEWMKDEGTDFVFTREKEIYMDSTSKTMFWGYDDLNQPFYRHIIEPRSGSGLVFILPTLAHETRHGQDHGHPHTDQCDPKYTNDVRIEDRGAWWVHYEVTMMMADNTGDFFSKDTQEALRYSAQEILKIRFCE